MNNSYNLEFTSHETMGREDINCGQTHGPAMLQCPPAEVAQKG